MHKLKAEERGKNILYERQLAHLHDVHRKKVLGASSHLVKLGYATAPKTVPQVVKANLKKRMKDDERLAQIETENARLLASMAKIYEAPDTKTRLKKPPISSLNVNLRRREMQRVTEDNLRMLKNLETTPSYYNHRVWQSERKETEHILTYMGLYPYEDGKGVRKKEPRKKHSDMDDAWLRSIASLSRKSALSLPELTKPLEHSGHRERASSAAGTAPWTLPPMVQPTEEDSMARSGDMDRPSPKSQMGAATGPVKPSGPLKPLKPEKEKRRDSSSSEDEEEESFSTHVKQAPEPKPAAPLAPQRKAPKDDSGSEDEGAPAASKKAQPARGVGSTAAAAAADKSAAPAAAAEKAAEKPKPAPAKAPPKPKVVSYDEDSSDDESPKKPEPAEAAAPKKEEDALPDKADIAKEAKEEEGGKEEAGKLDEAKEESKEDAEAKVGPDSEPRKEEEDKDQAGEGAEKEEGVAEQDKPKERPPLVFMGSEEDEEAGEGAEAPSAEEAKAAGPEGGEVGEAAGDAAAVEAKPAAEAKPSEEGGGGEAAAPRGADSSGEEPAAPKKESKVVSEVKQAVEAGRAAAQEDQDKAQRQETPLKGINIPEDAAAAAAAAVVTQMVRSASRGGADVTAADDFNAPAAAAAPEEPAMSTYQSAERAAAAAAFQEGQKEVSAAAAAEAAGEDAAQPDAGGEQPKDRLPTPDEARMAADVVMSNVVERVVTSPDIASSEGVGGAEPAPSVDAEVAKEGAKKERPALVFMGEEEGQEGDEAEADASAAPAAPQGEEETDKAGPAVVEAEGAAPAPAADAPAVAAEEAPAPAPEEAPAPAAEEAPAPAAEAKPHVVPESGEPLLLKLQGGFTFSYTFAGLGNVTADAVAAPAATEDKPAEQPAAAPVAVEEAGAPPAAEDADSKPAAAEVKPHVVPASGEPLMLALQGGFTFAFTWAGVGSVTANPTDQGAQAAAAAATEEPSKEASAEGAPEAPEAAKEDVAGADPSTAAPAEAAADPVPAAEEAPAPAPEEAPAPAAEEVPAASEEAKPHVVPESGEPLLLKLQGGFTFSYTFAGLGNVTADAAVLTQQEAVAPGGGAPAAEEPNATQEAADAPATQEEAPAEAAAPAEEEAPKEAASEDQPAMAAPADEGTKEEPAGGDASTETAVPAAEDPAAQAEAPAPPAVESTFRLPEIEAEFDAWLQGQLDASPADAKDTEEFRYLTFSELPPFTDLHKSLMRKTMTPELFAKLKDVKTSKGYTLSNGMQAGVLRPHLGVGFTAGDEESFSVFKEVIYPIVEGWHKFNPETQEHKSDLDASKVVMSEEQVALFQKYVKSTRVRAARNISGYGLPAGASKEDRLAVEGVLKEAFGGLPADLQGTYYPLGELSTEQEDALQAGGFLFQKPGPMQLLGAAGAGRDWPEGRGIFHNESKTVLCWCNEEDQCRIIAMEDGGDVKGVFGRFCALSDAIKAAAEANGKSLMYDAKLGFLGTCPSNLGTGLRASVMIVLPELNKDVHKLEEICAGFDLQPRGSSGEHSAAVGGKWDISNKQRIGFSEVELVQKMVDGITKIIAMEEELAAKAVGGEAAAPAEGSSEDPAAPPASEQGTPDGEAGGQEAPPVDAGEAPPAPAEEQPQAAEVEAAAAEVPAEAPATADEAPAPAEEAPAEAPADAAGAPSEPAGEAQPEATEAPADPPADAPAPAEEAAEAPTESVEGTG